MCIKTDSEHRVLGCKRAFILHLPFRPWPSDLFWNWWWRQSNPNNKDQRRRFYKINVSALLRWRSEFWPWKVGWGEFKVRRPAGSAVLYLDMCYLFYVSARCCTEDRGSWGCFSERWWKPSEFPYQRAPASSHLPASAHPPQVIFWNCRVLTLLCVWLKEVLTTQEQFSAVSHSAAPRNNLCLLSPGHRHCETHFYYFPELLWELKLQ